MTSEELAALFKKHGGDGYLNRNLVLDKKYTPSTRGDLNAFILLDRLCPDEARRDGYYLDMVSCAEHDEIWLSISLEDLAASAVTEEDVLALVKFGVIFDSHHDVFRMNV